MSRRSWTWTGPPRPDPPKPKRDAFEAAVLRAMLATPVPAAWDGKGIR